MGWTENLKRTPTWAEIVLTFFIGLLPLTIAVLETTRFADQVATHGDGLLTVFLAAAGGFGIGSGVSMLRHRAAMRHGLGVDPTAAG